ncbi:hypothetical protein T439DRAFT_357348 [Meredithblackwellia eburnea MCA 4105]
MSIPQRIFSSSERSMSPTNTLAGEPSHPHPHSHESSVEKGIQAYTNGEPDLLPEEQKGSVSLSLKKLTGNGAMLIVVFWAVACWMYGTLYRSEDHAYKLNVIVADFDQGPVGAALLSAIASVNGIKTYPTFHIVAANSTSPEQLQHRTFTGEFWGSYWAAEGASAAFEAALESDSVAASYNPANAWWYSGLEVRYATIWQGFLLSSFETIQASAAQVFANNTVVPYLSSLNATLGVNQARVLSGPVSASFLNLAPLEFGARVVLNTVAFVFPCLAQFFFILGLNGIFGMEGLYDRLNFRQHLKLRVPIELIWTLTTGLSIVAWGFVFDEGFRIKAKNFFAMWAVGWVNNMIFFDFLDIIFTWVPLPFAPPIVVSFIILAVSSSLYPITVCNNFFRIHYAFPPHATWETMITIWGNGAANKLYYDLPVLAFWLVAGKIGWVLALRARANRIKSHNQ